MDLSKFHVVSVISNPMRFQSRYKLYRDFEKHIKSAGVQLTTVEMAFGDRPHEVTEPNNPRHLQLRSVDELWHKENMINLGISILPRDWQYVAWVDADIQFTNPKWAEETVHALQHYQVVQMFSHAQDLGPNFEIIQKHNGFMWSYFDNNFHPPIGPGQGGYYQERPGFWHPGYAWAATREAINAMGGLMDWPILGAADHHMAFAFIGKVQRSVPANIGRAYLRELLEWQERCERWILRDVGYVPGVINHYWHGKKKDRKYIERWDIITKNNFDPDKDLRRDWQGLWCLNEDRIRLRDEIRAYFRARNEDSIDLE